MTATKQLTLPVTGMTCANCVATVERNLKKLDGVGSAVVNLSSERATVEFDPALLEMNDVIARIERAGYGIATGEADLVIKRLADDNDARRLEKAFLKLDGVLEAQVNYTTEKARVRYIPTVVTQAEIRRAVIESGFEALELGGDAEDAEAKAREHEINEQRRLLHHRFDFHHSTLPVLDEPGLWPAPDDVDGSRLAEMADVCAGNPGAILRWLAVLCGCLQVPAQWLGQHGRADRHGIIGGLSIFGHGYAGPDFRACLF